MITTLSHVEQLEGNPRLKMYIYIDGMFVYKTRTYENSSNPVMGLEMDM